MKDQKSLSRFKGMQTIAKERQAKPPNQKQSKSPEKLVVLKVEEDGEEHYYEVLDKMCP